MSRYHLANPKLVLKGLRLQWTCFWFALRSQTYQTHMNYGYVLDTLLEPISRFMHNYVRHLGPLFVGFLMSMMGLVILCCYVIIVPYEWARTAEWKIVVYFAVGNWLLVNTLFHYTMGWVTAPGTVPSGHLIRQAVSMCKHCISPKPPRAHHCRICRKCILQMDHHCPWLNQCVGHFNHRYFYLCMVYMWLGCIFIVWGSSWAFWEHAWNESEPTAPWCSAMVDKLFYAKYACQQRSTVSRSLQRHPWLRVPRTTTIAFNDDIGMLSLEYGVGIHNTILFIFFTSMAMVVGLGGLLAWHTWLISHGQTSIEQHINKETRKRFALDGKDYRNPYDFGVCQNWRIFLGLTERNRTFLRHVLLPSRHKPREDGLSWTSATYTLGGRDAEDVSLGGRAHIL